MSWASRELEQTQLGDKRRERRLMKMVEDLAGSPESSVPCFESRPGRLQGMYDFWSNRRIKAADILSGYIWSTVNRGDSQGRVLAAKTEHQREGEWTLA